MKKILSIFTAGFVLLLAFCSINIPTVSADDSIPLDNVVMLNTNGIKVYTQESPTFSFFRIDEGTYDPTFMFVDHSILDATIENPEDNLAVLAHSITPLLFDTVNAPTATNAVYTVTGSDFISNQLNEDFDMFNTDEYMLSLLSDDMVTIENSTINGATGNIQFSNNWFSVGSTKALPSTLRDALYAVRTLTADDKLQDNEGTEIAPVLDYAVFLRPAGFISKSSIAFTLPYTPYLNSKTASKNLTANIAITNEEKEDDLVLAILDSRDTDSLTFSTTTTSLSAYISEEVSIPVLHSDNTEQIWAMIVDSNENILYYGTLAETISEVNEVSLVIPNTLASGDYTLKLSSLASVNDLYLTSPITDIPLEIKSISATFASDSSEDTQHDFSDLYTGYTTTVSQNLIITNKASHEVSLSLSSNIPTTNFIVTGLTSPLASSLSQTVTITPKANLPAGDYSETLTFSTATDSFSVEVSVTVVQSTYSINVDTSTLSFSDTVEGAAVPPAQTVTVTNTGNQPITLTQPTATNFDIGTLSTTSLAPNATATFTVTPKASLLANTYSESIVISTNQTNITATTTASYKVLPKTYTISLDSSQVDTGSFVLGDSLSASNTKTITVTNTGNQTITLNQPTATNFDIGALSTTSLAPNATATFTISPKTTLTIGDYSEDITVSTTNSTQSSVKAITEVTPILTTNTTSLNFGSADEGYTTKPTTQFINITNNSNSDITDLRLNVGSTSGFLYSVSIDGATAIVPTTGTNLTLPSKKTLILYIQPTTGIKAGHHTQSYSFTRVSDTAYSLNLTAVYVVNSLASYENEVWGGARSEITALQSGTKAYTFETSFTYIPHYIFQAIYGKDVTLKLTRDGDTFNFNGLVMEREGFNPDRNYTFAELKEAGYVNRSYVTQPSSTTAPTPSPTPIQTPDPTATPTPVPTATPTPEETGTDDADDSSSIPVLPLAGATAVVLGGLGFTLYRKKK